MRVYYAHKPQALVDADAAFTPAERFSERDVVLITYGDLLTTPGRPPLQVLASFLRRFMRGAINTVHILPFFPYSSDRGFSIIDYEEVDPRLGSWDDIAVLAAEFRLMFDGVFNHASSRSRWFQRFLNGHPGYEDFFVAFTTRDAIDPDYLRLILRPRTSDLLTPFRTINGMRFVWTTFSPDQVDLNFRNPRVLLRVVEILLAYVRRGADVVRLDAVTYIWRELGTSCAHLRETHALVQLFRAILDVVAPRVALDHRDQRAARRQHQLLRQRRRRGAAGLQLRAAAARPAHLPHRFVRGPRALGARRSRRFPTPPTTSTSSPRTTASACSARAAS